MTEQTALKATAGAFRPSQYMGSKARMLGWIRQAVDLVDPSRGPAVDLFSGSGVVAAHLSRERSVTAVDVQEYSRVLASAVMSPARMTQEEIERLRRQAEALYGERRNRGAQPLLECELAAIRALDGGDAEPFCEIVEHGSVAAFEVGESPPAALETALGLVSTELDQSATLARHYGGVYFSYSQALQLDSILEIVRALPNRYERDTGLAAALGAASEVVTSVGSHFAQPIRPRDKNGLPKHALLATAVRRRERSVFAEFVERLERYADLPGAAYQSTALRCDYRDFLASNQKEVAVVYADPPYTRDHYSRFYHVLETMARGDLPTISRATPAPGSPVSRGLYREDRHQSPFCIRSQAPAAFEALFAASRRFDAPLVVSYSPYTYGTVARPKPRLLTMPELAELASNKFRDVELRSPGPLKHSKFNSRHLNGEAALEAELLLVCTP